MILLVLKVLGAIALVIYGLFFSVTIIAGLFEVMEEVSTYLQDRGQRARAWLQSAWSSSQDPWTYP